MLVVAVAYVQKPAAKPRKAKPPESGFRLVALTDLVYLPKPEETSDTAITETKRTLLFRVLRDGEGPKDGFFDVGGKPVAYGLEVQ